MRFKYPKDEKLKSRKTIDSLFSQGKSVAKYPLRLVYIEDLSNDSGNVKMGVSVSKKHFKKAHDRNYFKRVLRETYRMNKHLLVENLDRPYAFMFLYQTKDRLAFEEIQSKTILLFEKFALAIKENSNSNQAT
jgi:ribonuclease P protein component